MTTMLRVGLLYLLKCGAFAHTRYVFSLFMKFGGPPKIKGKRSFKTHDEYAEVWPKLPMVYKENNKLYKEKQLEIITLGNL